MKKCYKELLEMIYYMKNYIVYTDNTTDEAGNKRVYASTFDPKEANPVLGPIESEKEWKIIEDILNKLQQEK